MGADEDAQLSGDGEGDQIIGHGQETAALSIQPLSRVSVAALRTGPMIAGVIGKVELAAIAAEQLPAQRRSSVAGTSRCDVRIDAVCIEAAGERLGWPAHGTTLRISE